MTKLLEQAIEKVKALPEPDQDIAAEFLLGFADPEGQKYRLTAEQLREVELAKQEAQSDRFATPAQMDEMWRRFDR
jgi:hypothetical protein